jgi:hypothetical protein
MIKNGRVLTLNPALASTNRSGIYTLDELNTLVRSSGTVWNAGQPVLTATTHSTGDAGAFSYANQPIGDADANKVVYVVLGYSVNAAPSTGATSVTLATSPATLLVASSGSGVGSGHCQIWAARMTGATTTATILVTMGATMAQIGCHVYAAKGGGNIDQAFATATTVAATTATSISDLTLAVPAGAFGIVANYVRLVLGGTIGFNAGSTVTAFTSLGGEVGGLLSGIITPTTAARSISIVTTYTTGAGGVNVPAQLIAAALR